MALNIAEYCREKGYAASLAAAWQARGIDRFAPLQQQALERGLDDSFDTDALIAAPPGAGKSLIAELRAAAHLTRGERVLWFVPTRALARLQGEALRATFATQGWNVHIADEDGTGAASGNNAEGRDGLPANFDLTVAVYEKGLQWLVRRPHDLADAGLVVIDELTMLRDAERGATLVTLIALLRASPYAPRRIGLCAPVAEAARLAAWWGGALLESRQRPGPLREGVATLATNGDCLFRWRERAGNGEGEETLATGEALRAIVDDAEMPFDGSGGRGTEALLPTLALAAELARRDEATLLFAPTRSQAREWARRLAGVALNVNPKLAGAQCEAARLARAEPCHDHALLESLLATGVGMHHADLSPAARRIMEIAFAEGHLRLLVATPTLAQGVNLPVKNVLHWPQTLEPQAGGGWSERPLEYWRYLDQAGRAGRLGGSTKEIGGEAQGGRSIIVALRPRQAARYWRQYVVGEAEPLRAAPTVAEKELFTLRALAGDVARTPENLKVMLDQAWGFAKHAHDVDDTKYSPRYSHGLRGIIRRAQAAGLVRPSSRTAPLRLTPLGQICARHGIALETLARLRMALESLQCVSPHAAEPLAMLALLALAAPPGLWPRCSAEAARGKQDWEAWFEAQGLIFPPPLREHLNGANFSSLDTTALYAALHTAERLGLWISPQPTAEVEMQSGWTAGMLARAGEGLAWLARAAAAVGLALEPEKRLSPAMAAALRLLACRLPEGLTAEALPLASLMDSNLALGRTALQSLAREGWGSLEALAEATPASITKMATLLGDAALAEATIENARRLLAFAEQKENKRKREKATAALTTQPKTQPQTAPHTPPVPPPATGSAVPEQTALLLATSPLLTLDLQSPGIVRVAGQELCLPPLLFDLLAALAECPGRVLARGAIYHKLWPEGGPEEQQIDAHRRRLNAALRPALGATAPDPVQMVRGMGLRLNIAENRVELRRG